MALPVNVPNQFATATASIPLSQLDTNFDTLSNAINGIANGVESLANVQVTGGAISNVSITNSNVVSTNVEVIAGTGLTGGGNLSANVTLSIANTAVTPDTYGGGTNAAQITVDQQGRVTSAANVAIPQGTVTSVDVSGGTTGLTTSGGPVTGSGTITLSGTLAVANGGTGITSLGSGVATFLGTPSSSNLANAVTDETGSGALVFATSPTLVTPVLGTPTSGTLSNCTVDGTDAVGFRNTPVNSQSANYTLVLTDSGKTILHPIADNNARTFTIPANSSVAYPIGTAITFVNLINTVTIAITTDTMYLANDGSTGSRSLAAYGVATAVKVASTTWVISGNGLT